MDINDVKPYNQQEEKTKQLNKMFNTISRQYDKFNDIMSLGLARKWRTKAVQELKQYNPEYILDIAAGTADLCINMYKHLAPKQIIGIDISEKMMEIGQKKVDAVGFSEYIHLEMGDVSKLQFPNESFDAATTSFGIRNFEKLEKSIQEIHRVLIPSGKFMVLEMSEPENKVINFGYRMYVKTLIPFAVKTFDNDIKAYSYLTASINAFPQGEELIEIFRRNGFKTLKYKTFFMGVCSLYILEKV